MQFPLVRYDRRPLLAGLLLLLACIGCSPAGPASSAADQAQTGGPQAAPLDEFWEAFYLQGAKVGHAHTVRNQVTVDGQRLVQTDSESRLVLTRFGKKIEQNLSMYCLETDDGNVVRFGAETNIGPVPSKVEGRVEGSTLVLETTTLGKQQTEKVQLPSDVKGFLGIEESLERSPMKPGERRGLRVLVPMYNQVGQVELTAQDYEQAELLSGTQELLRVESIVRLPDGGTLETIMWSDKFGRTLKTRMEQMQYDSYRTTREEALSEGNGPSFDVGADVAVKVDRPLERPHDTRRVRYRVELANGDPSEVFVTSAGQEVKPLGKHQAEVTVRALAHSTKTETPTGPAPSDDDRLPNSLIQSDDPLIIEMAAEAVGSETDPLKKALALEQYVSRTIDEKNFSHAFASAAEVAATREGDCTEHAVLLAALARANGLPARVAMGLVYAQEQQGFLYHMWNEVYIDGRWLPLDATLARSGIGAAHLKLADSNLHGASTYSSFLPVAKVLGQLKIEILEVE